MSGNDLIIQKVSVIIVARNEEENILNCLASIVANDYDHEAYEIILIDDHSEDDTARIARSAGITNLNVHSLSEVNGQIFGKKKGQIYGVRQARHPIVLFTDADCIVPKYWLKTMLSFKSNYDFVTGPVQLIHTDNFLSRWQYYDLIGTMVVTKVGIATGMWYSANAANMICNKEDYKRFAERQTSSHSSGDDIFLVNDLRHAGKSIGFAHDINAIVSTSAERTLVNLFNQRLRWATKTAHYNLTGLKVFMLTTFLFHAYLFTILIAAAIGIGFSPLIPLILFGCKWAGDWFVIQCGSSFFNVNVNWFKTPIYTLAHLIYVVIIGLSGSVISQYSWKGRKTR